MKKILIISIILCCQAICKAQDSKDIQWISFEQLSDSLEFNPKKVLLFFHTDWCGYCKKMMKETFRNQEIIQKINKNYYAVKMDAESIDTIYFEKIAYTNVSTIKRNKQYHALAKVFFATPNQPTFPITIILSQNFSILSRENQYLSIQQFLKKL